MQRLDQLQLQNVSFCIKHTPIHTTQLHTCMHTYFDMSMRTYDNMHDVFYSHEYIHACIHVQDGIRQHWGRVQYHDLPIIHTMHTPLPLAELASVPIVNPSWKVPCNARTHRVQYKQYMQYMQYIHIPIQLPMQVPNFVVVSIPFHEIYLLQPIIFTGSESIHATCILFITYVSFMSALQVLKLHNNVFVKSYIYWEGSIK